MKDEKFDSDGEMPLEILNSAVAVSSSVPAGESMMPPTDSAALPGTTGSDPTVEGNPAPANKRQAKSRKQIQGADGKVSASKASATVAVTRKRPKIVPRRVRPPTLLRRVRYLLIIHFLNLAKTEARKKSFIKCF